MAEPSKSRSFPFDFAQGQDDKPILSADEVDVGFVGNDSALVAHIEELADGFAAVVAVVDGAVVDVHADEAVGHRGVEIAGELHSILESLFAVIEGMLDAVAQGIGGDELDLRAE